jgi:hypothetical protein
MKEKPIKRRKAKGDRKEAAVRIRMTEQDKEDFEEAAARESLDLSSWMRSVARRYIDSKA